MNCQNASQSPLPEGSTLVLQGSSSSTALFDAEALTFTSSASLPEALGPGTSSFRIDAGMHRGMTMTILGTADNTGGKTFLFDPATHRFSPGPPLAYGMAQPGVHFSNRVYPHLHLYSRNDASVHAYNSDNQTWSFVGPSVPAINTAITIQMNHGTQIFSAILRSSGTTFYDHSVNRSILFASVPLLILAGANVSVISAGANAGKGLLVSGGGQGQTFVLTVSHGQIIPTPGPFILNSPLPNLGSSSTVIETGVSANNILVVHGAASTATSVYDANTNDFIAGPSLTAPAGEGAHIVTIQSGTHAGKFLVIHGNNSVTTSLYEPSTGQFSTGPSLPFALGAGGHSVSLD